MGGEGDHSLTEPPSDPFDGVPAALPADPPPEDREGGFLDDIEPIADATPRRQISDAEISAQALRHQEERDRLALLRPPMTPEEAQRIVQRRRVCYRAHVSGGSKDRWYVSGRGNQVTDAELVELAEEIVERAG